MNRFKAVFLSILVLVILPGCGNAFSFKETRLAMDTFVEISCFSPRKDVAIKAMKEAFGEIDRIEKIFSRFDKESEVYRINRLAGSKDLTISPELFRMLERSMHYSDISVGSFDITASSMSGGSYKDIALDKNNMSISFNDNDIKIDLGAIAKGYAVDRAKDIMDSYGIKNALINIGGNMFAMGSPPYRKTWRIGIQDPSDNKNIIYRLSLRDKGISTSGNYERPFHIIDPKDGKPVQKVKSVTVVADSAEEADALSTAIFVMGIEKAEEFVRLFKDIKVFIVDKDGNIKHIP